VDAMRFDVADLVRVETCRALGAKAQLAERLVLWSALPTTTARQLDLLAHGASALDAEPPSEREGEGVRGRTAETIRRVRVGARDVYKLDVVASRLAGGAGARARGARGTGPGAVPEVAQ